MKLYIIILGFFALGVAVGVVGASFFPIAIKAIMCLLAFALILLSVADDDNESETVADDE